VEEEKMEDIDEICKEIDLALEKAEKEIAQKEETRLRRKISKYKREGIKSSIYELKPKLLKKLQIKKLGPEKLEQIFKTLLVPIPQFGGDQKANHNPLKRENLMRDPNDLKRLSRVYCL